MSQYTIEYDFEPEGYPAKKKTKNPVQKAAERAKRVAVLSVEQAYPKALSYTLNLLNARSYSQSELRSKLSGRGYNEETIQLVLGRLKELNLIDDTKYAARLAAQKAQVKGLAPKALRVELKRKGFDAKDIEAAIETLPKDEDAIIRLAKKKARTLNGIEYAKAKQRLLSFLARKGYGYSEALKIAQNALEDHPEV